MKKKKIKKECHLHAPNLWWNEKKNCIYKKVEHWKQSTKAMFIEKKNFFFLFTTATIISLINILHSSVPLHLNTSDFHISLINHYIRWYLTRWWRRYHYTGGVSWCFYFIYLFLHINNILLFYFFFCHCVFANFISCITWLYVWLNDEKYTTVHSSTDCLNEDINTIEFSLSLLSEVHTWITNL